MMWGWIVFAVFMEAYSVGMTILAYRTGMKNYGFCLIPFVAFFFLDKILPEGFTIIGIRVKKMGALVLKLFVVCLAVYLYMQWGITHLASRNIEPLQQIALVPIGICVIIFWTTITASTLALLFGFEVSFKGEVFVCALLFTAPVLLAVMNKERKTINEFRRKQ